MADIDLSIEMKMKVNARQKLKIMADGATSNKK